MNLKAEKDIDVKKEVRDVANQEHDEQHGDELVCPYLDTIDRKALDFDFEKVCCVSLYKVNIYACLVCGKYYQGRGVLTHAYTHSVRDSHHVFLNLETKKFYCLPDNYQVRDETLNDILHLLQPTFTKEEIESLDTIQKPIRPLNGKLYYPGIVGLNNLKSNDYCNVIFHLLSHVKPLRNFFLTQSQSVVKGPINDDKFIIFKRYGELMRKIWNLKNFKSHVSPHEILQAIVVTSKKKFEFTKQGDPIVFLGWLLSTLLGPKREKSSIIQQTLEGKMKVYSRQVIDHEKDVDSENLVIVPVAEEKVDTVSFLYLTLDLPSMSLYPEKTPDGQVIKPQISIYDLLSKYDGKSENDYRHHKELLKQRYQVMKLPQYLIIYIKRFTRNEFFVEKNTHIVDFPITNLNLSNTLNLTQASSSDQTSPLMYNLIANIVHDGEPSADKCTYKAHILHEATGKWFELQDLYVTEMTDTSLIKLSETYIQLWQLNK